MSIASAAVALERELPFGDRVLKLKPLTYEALARFSAWLEEKTRLAMQRAGDDPLAWREAFLSLASRGEFEPGGASFGAAAQSEAGGRKILELCLDEKDAGPLSFALYADERAYADAMAVVAELNNDPLAIRARRSPTRPAAPSP